MCNGPGFGVGPGYGTGLPFVTKPPLARHSPFPVKYFRGATRQIESRRSAPIPQTGPRGLALFEGFVATRELGFAARSLEIGLQETLNHEMRLRAKPHQPVGFWAATV